MKAEWRDGIGDSVYRLFVGDVFLGLVWKTGEGYFGRLRSGTDWSITESTRGCTQRLVATVARDAMQAKVDALEELLDREEEGGA